MLFSELTLYVLTSRIYIAVQLFPTGTQSALLHVINILKEIKLPQKLLKQREDKNAFSKNKKSRSPEIRVISKFYGSVASVLRKLGNFILSINFKRIHMIGGKIN